LTHSRADIAANVERARALQEKLENRARAVVRTELAVAMTHVRIARHSKSCKASHEAAIARRAYETIIRLNQPRQQAGEFVADLDTLKTALRELGERV
jgi:hypothetical protein